MYRLLLVILVFPCLVLAKGIYQEPDDFISEVYLQEPPKPDKLWITGDIKKEIVEIMGHDLGVLRLRYWIKDGRSTWILEEIGKERPITTGIVVNNDQIEQVRVLIFRESRGWEVRYPFFTDQFTGAVLEKEMQLDRHIDGISGATLSVNAVTKLARLALYLHQTVTKSTRE